MLGLRRVPNEPAAITAGFTAACASSWPFIADTAAAYTASDPALIAAVPAIHVRFGV